MPGAGAGPGPWRSRRKSEAVASALRTTAASGDWSAGATWVGGVAPNPGDTIAIAAGHTITGNVGFTIGTSGANDSVAMTIATGGVLNLGAFLYVCRGDVVLNGTGTINQGIGTIWEWDSSGAASPASTNYKGIIGNTHASGARWNGTGSAGSRTIMRSNAGGGNGFLRAGPVAGAPWLQLGLGTWSQFEFLRIGNATDRAIEPNASTGSPAFSMTDGVMTACGRIENTLAFGADANFTLRRVTWRNTVGTKSFSLLASAALTTGSRVIDEVVFDKTGDFFAPIGFDVTGTLFGDGYITTAENFKTWSNNLVVQKDSSRNVTMYGIMNTTYFLFNDAAAVNPHFVSFLNPNTPTGAQEINDCVFDFVGTDDQGDCILIGTPSAARTLTMRRNITLKNKGSGSSGTPFSALGNANVTLIYEHNTYYTGSQGAAVGETYAGHAGMLSSFRSNLAWDDAGSRGLKLFDSGTNDTVSDLVTSANANFNGGFNLLAGSNLKGYNNLEFSSGSPGANDVAGDPVFFAPTRRASSWDTSLGGPGTEANLLTELGKRNDATGYNAAYTISALRTWVRAGFAVSNAAYINAGHDSITIGAIP